MEKKQVFIKNIFSPFWSIFSLFCSILRPFYHFSPLFRDILYGQYAKGVLPYPQTRRVVFVRPLVVVAMALSRSWYSLIMRELYWIWMNMNNNVKARIIFKITKRNVESVTKNTKLDKTSVHLYSFRKEIQEMKKISYMCYKHLCMNITNTP